jgi:4-amino-4-deoxy-L-arabinose transferase-like glycosyltransferase
MVLLGAGAIALLFLLGAVLGGTATGLVTAALALSSPFIRYTLVHVWAEAPLALFLVLSALLGAIGPKRVLAGGSVVAWAIALGVGLGLASATKLTGLVGLAVLCGAVTLAAVWLLRAGRPDAARRIIGWAALSCVVAVVLFVAVNPYLWRGPVVGLVGMLEERRDEMAFQQEQWPEYAVLSWSERPWLTLSGSLQVGPLAETPAAALVNLPFLVVGIVGAVMLLRQAEPMSPAGMLVAWMLGYIVAIVLGLGLKYPRYFMPTTLLFLPVLALGFVIAVRAVWHRASQALRRP